MSARPWTLLLAGFLVCCRRGPESSRTLVLAMDQDVITIDPHQHDDSVTHSVLSNVYDALVTFDREMRIVPALAESWSNPTDLIWRIRLRAGVRFHDGRPLTASDVKYSLERALRMKSAHYLVSITRIEVLDGTALELQTSAPQPVLLNKLAVVGIVPAGTPDTTREAVGTGAYRVVGRVPGKSLTLAANDAFWGGELAIRRAVFRVLPDPDERARALVRGEIHLAREVTRSQLAGAGTGIAFVSDPGLAVVVLGASFGAPGPLQRKEVRQAIFWALDPRELVEKSGIEALPADEIVPPSVFGFLPRKEAGRPQLARSRELLRVAGIPDGFDVTLEMSRSIATSVGPVLADQLGRAGIRTTVAGLDWPQLSARLERQESPFFCAGWSCYGDASDIFDAVLHTRDGNRYGASNFGGYRNPEMDRAIERAASILLPALRLTALHEAMKISMEDLPLIPLYNRNRTYGVDRRVRFQPRQNGQVLLREMSWADTPDTR